MDTKDRMAILALRLGTDDDAAAITRLAALDSAAVPCGELLLGVVDGRLVAALSLADGAVVADPFTPTADLVALMRQRAHRLAAPKRGVTPRRRLSVLARQRRPSAA